MKSSQQMFNPAIEDYKILKEVVVEREDDLNSILERLESTPLKGTSRNFIVMGPRGIGKTHFLLLIYYEIKERKGLSEKYVSIKFSEEEYSIDSLAFFFIRIFEELSNELGSEKEKAQINEFLELNSKLENREFVNLADAFLEKLMHKHRKKIVLCCENLDEMFKRISSSDKTDMGRLRSILQSRDYLLIMGSASTYFKEIKDYGEPFYHFFEHVRLSNLSDDGIEELIMKLAKIEDNKQVIKEFGKFRGKIKIITHFTGGVPRLVRMVYYVIANLEITEVMEEFEKLLDEVTPYYQSRMMGLSPQQQKIMDVIALGEGTRTPTEIADAGRMDRAIVNAQVKKLSDAGFIQLVKQRRR
ncbi:MAG: AAA family ATPase, partial [Candidatus Aenigmarchaeota archaeon]|nr:AAA family ATPase [Candidatus Aenigmarchaeota archaeon]